LAVISIAVPLGWGFTMIRVAQQFANVLKGEFRVVDAEDIR